MNVKKEHSAAAGCFFVGKTHFPQLLKKLIHSIIWHNVQPRFLHHCDVFHTAALVHSFAPTGYSAILQDAREKFTRFAQVVFGEETAEEGIDALSAFIQECGLPTKMG